MEVKQSLLGQFYSRIRGSQEDIATEGVNYILGKSGNARGAIVSIVQQVISVEVPELAYRTQAVGENQERPDIVGCSVDGVETIVIESKFWAALTDNQPITYLDRLSRTHNAVLVFVCPALRVRSLWHEVADRLKGHLAEFRPENHTIKTAGGQHVMIITWDQLLGGIRDRLVHANEFQLISDLDQIIGFCNTIDRNAFIPISDADLSPSIARRLISFYDLVDKVIDELGKHHEVNLKGMKATAQRWGYCRYFKVADLGLSMVVHFELWAKDADTPFWLGVQRQADSGWHVDSRLREQVGRASIQFRDFVNVNGQIPHFPLHPKKDAPESEVVRDIAERIAALLTIILGNQIAV